MTTKKGKQALPAVGDAATIDYYNQHAAQVFDSYEQVEGGVSAYFQSSFWPGARILDVGAGSGRDLRKLLELGYNAYGVEPSDGLRAEALARYPMLRDRLLAGAVPAPLGFYPGTFDGVVCSAVLMHLPSNQLFDALVALREQLKDHGRLLISIPAARPDVIDQRDDKGRLFAHLPVEQLKLLCARLGLECITEYHNDDAMGRAGTSWATLLFVKRAAVGKPLDRIEQVLRKDKKVATYKLALLRALCDLSEHDDRAVSWRNDGKVAIPMRNIAEQWLLYYWPLVASKQLIPQMQGEASGKHVLAFRPLLTALIERFSAYFYSNESFSRENSSYDAFLVKNESNDTVLLLSQFMLAWKRGRLPTELQRLLAQVLTKIAATVRSGPVAYADDGTMFGYDSGSKSVLVDAELWREFCLVGYWVRDSLLLRWAELVTRLSPTLPYVTQGLVMDLLLQRPLVEREQRLAREIFAGRDDLRCVWSDRPIPAGKLAMDHVLPFSIWLNNDLWNLQPTHTAVNGAKSDRVPSVPLLRKREDALVSNWRVALDAEPALFTFEVERCLGAFRKHAWELQLFDYLRERAEQAVYSVRVGVWNGV
jgi:SAM-dependent methyltransferase